MRSELPTITLDPVWAIDELQLGQTLDRLTEASIEAAIRLPRHLDPGLPMEEQGPVAVIDISGVLTKSPSILHRFVGGTSIERIREAFAAAWNSQEITGILFRIDSPGGSVSGLAELGDEIYQARQEGTKPIIAQVCGMCASAAAYLGLQADRVYAHRMDAVGSIGTRTLLYDLSRMFENAGVRAIPIDTGAYKSAGAPGTPITEEQRAYFQGLVDAFFGDFVSAVARGRGMTEDAVREIADGRIFMATEALDMKLIDGIQTFEQTLADLQAGGKPSNRQRGSGSSTRADSTTPKLESETMSNESKAVTIAELKAAFPGSTPEFRESCIERGLTMESAKDAWIEQLTAQNEARDATIQEKDKTISELQTKAAKAPKRNADGVDPLNEAERGNGGGGGGASVDGDGTAKFNEAVTEHMRIHQCPRHEAHAAVCREQPDLREAMVAEHNVAHGRRIPA